MQRRIDIHVRAEGERQEHAVWVDEDASQSEREDAVEEVVADVRSWTGGPVEIVHWGASEWVKEEGWGATPTRSC